VATKQPNSEMLLSASAAAGGVEVARGTGYFALAHSMTGMKGPSADGIGAAAR
jgi:hypothetical protein